MFTNVHVCDNVLWNLVEKCDRTGGVHDIKERKSIHNEVLHGCCSILGLDSVETNPKFSLRKRSTPLNHCESDLRILKENKPVNWPARSPH